MLKFRLVKHTGQIYVLYLVIIMYVWSGILYRNLVCNNAENKRWV